ncbi:MAG TPA: type II secretion system protein GspC [Gammaproteobacteria bacterium]|nr:type II secretion system protein GspC [Gammaproteobacteria bacterium]
MTKTYLDKTVIPFFQQQLTRLTLWVTVLLVLMLAYSLAQLTWLLFPASNNIEENGALLQPTLSRKATSGVKPTAVVNLASLHLFGTAAATNEKKSAVIAEDVPDTRLRLILRGVIATQDKDMARAIISEPGGEEKYYAVDDKLPGGALLKEIAADRVILQSRAGRMETLRLPKEFGGSGRATRGTATTRVNNKPTGRNKITPRISSAELREYRDKMLSNPQELVGLIRTRPVKENGQIKGYKLFPGKDRALFNRLGLRSGDVIVSVNGMELSDPASGLALLGQLSSATEMSVVVERRGQRQTVTLSLQ